MADPWRIRATGDRIDKEAIKGAVRIEEVATKLLGEPPGRGGSRGLWFKCFCHDDRNPSLHVDPERGLWHCFGCGEGGDVFGLVMKHENMTFPEALAFLAGDGIQAPVPRRPPPVKRPEPKPSGIPVDRALAVALEAAQRLWRPEGRETLAYLRGRGFTDETIKAARLGFVRNLVVPKADGSGTFTVTGTAIPWFDGDRLAKINVRLAVPFRLRDGRELRYISVFQDRPLMHAPFDLRPGFPVIIAEGELEALLLAQELRDVADAITTGSAKAKLTAEAKKAAREAPALYLAHDADPAGDGAEALWPKRGERVRPPEPFKDWGDLHKADPQAIRRLWLPILRGENQALAEPEPVEGGTIKPAWLVESTEEAKAERKAIQEDDGIEGEPEPSMNPAEWLARFNALIGRENPPELVELQRRGLLDIQTTEGETLATEGEPDAFAVAIVDLFDATSITTETEAGFQAPAESSPSPKPWRESLASWPIDRRERWGLLANRLIDDGHPWMEAERLARVEAEAVAAA